MSNVVESNGKFYRVENGRVVAASHDKKELMPEQEARIELGSRVEAAGRLGKVISAINTMYGDSFGVRFDDGKFANFYLEDIKLSDVEEQPTYDDAVSQLVHEFEQYEVAPSDTLDQVQTKAGSARELNIRSKAMITDPKLPLSDRVKLDHIVTATAVDIGTLRQEEELLHLASDYVKEQPRYEISEEISMQNWSREDSSWLSAEAAAVEEEIAAIDWDTHLVMEAAALAESVPGDLLADAEVLGPYGAEGYKIASHNLSEEETEARRESFLAAFHEAVAIRREQASEALQTTASELEGLDDIPDEALFI